jgi:glycosyltransferase involved in cell wall biosynthesis
MQKKISSISIAIVTKNRSQKLSRCLFSILNQSHHPAEVIVIDNDPKLSVKNLIKSSAFAPLSISYFPSSGTVPECRNLALVKSKTKYLGFVDDDCVLKANWLMHGLSSLIMQQQAFIIGHTLLMNPRNIFALAQHARDSYWKARSICQDNYQDVFDTKNVIIDLEKIRRFDLKFDRKCHFGVYDSADFDFGFQLKKEK